MVSTKAAKLEKIAPWGILGFAVTTIGILISIAIFHFQENEGQVRANWLIRNEEKLVEVRETIKDLSILYQGKDILESGQELRILTLEFVNDGKNVTQDMYDQKLDFGLRFPKSEIITGQVVRVSSKYLEENLKPETKVSNQQTNSASTNKTVNDLLLPKLILDHGCAFTLKVYLLNSSRSEPSQIISLGKIAGLDNVPIISVPPVQATDNTRWVTAILTALTSCFVGLVIYGFGLRMKAKAIDRDYILEELRQELRDASQAPTIQDSKPVATVESSPSKPVNPVEPPTQKGSVQE